VIVESDALVTRLSGSGDDSASADGSGDASLAIALQIADAVESLTNLWTVAAQGASLRLSPHQLRALRVLESEPGLNLTALADRMEMGLPTASRLCDRLEAAGLLERVLHPRKRREVQLRLTGNGRQMLDEVASRRAHALAAVLAAMDAPVREALHRGMPGFLAARNRGVPEADTPEH
jgi:DNA-binding MarR family transcriptional regulator